MDYRSRRPTVVLDHNRIADVDPLEIGLHVVRDNAGKPFLLLTGPEPDMRWSAFTKAVADLAERFGVSQTVVPVFRADGRTTYSAVSGYCSWKYP